MNEIIIHDNWEALREFTDARIALGRTGSSIPMQKEFEFKLAYAHARDAVHSNMDTESLINGLQRFAVPILTLASQVSSRQLYLQRPDLGRLLDEESEKKVADFSSPNDLALIIADGLSATAINHNLLPLLDILLPGLKSAGLKPGPVSIVKQGRVAICDPVAYGLQSKITLMLIGERPGLSAADSIGAYITYDPRPGLTDESRNCVSNIRPRGLSFEKASEKILYIIGEAMKRKLSGTSLKDNAGLINE
ncbi:ethanolamine ammonia-lyase subunit EutC [Flavitalea sp.]|nr:ethanolamine ammonia-lyase subunit EutC [Flavitalea sp.]